MKPTPIDFGRFAHSQIEPNVFAKNYKQPPRMTWEDVLAREALQNILDARVDGSSEPAQAEFHVLNLTASQKQQLLDQYPIPSDHLKAILSSRDDIGLVMGLNSFLKSAQGCQVTVIRDFNTTGLVGGYELLSGDPYELFMHSFGVSAKTKGKSNGSEGVGKSVFIRSSAYGLMLIFTRTDAEGDRFAGTSLFPNHKVGKQGFFGQGKIGNGVDGNGVSIPFTGSDAQAHMNQLLEIVDSNGTITPRTSNGLDIILIGTNFKMEQIIGAYHKYFFPAISDGNLVASFFEDGVLQDASNPYPILEKFDILRKWAMSINDGNGQHPGREYLPITISTPIKVTKNENNSKKLNIKPGTVISMKIDPADLTDKDYELVNSVGRSGGDGMALEYDGSANTGDRNKPNGDGSDIISWFELNGAPEIAYANGTSTGVSIGELFKRAEEANHTEWVSKNVNLNGVNIAQKVVTGIISDTIKKIKSAADAAANKWKVKSVVEDATSVRFPDELIDLLQLDEMEEDIEGPIDPPTPRTKYPFDVSLVTIGVGKWKIVFASNKKLKDTQDWRFSIALFPASEKGKISPDKDFNIGTDTVPFEIIHATQSQSIKTGNGTLNFQFSPGSVETAEIHCPDHNNRVFEPEIIPERMIDGQTATSKNLEEEFSDIKGSNNE